ncbi:hypothetical protein LEP1GSC008_3730 [Leptospira kirschneri serovar Bulgarica str. Nikolaevo]|uniref:Uncharacterized protein n=1 Tax=Leptospira kirschneri serovar Bulgarica str. Nikolaevo TaxID=1240687 RepID=M6FCI6_9LEPT|nr:hypothetical protein LEP1GSC008_3730 [Leptospira kirschneri serovar Bulgarica str. Nikolaevo]
MSLRFQRQSKVRLLVPLFKKIDFIKSNSKFIYKGFKNK